MTNIYSDLVVMQRGGLTTSNPPTNSGVEVPTNPLIRFYNPDDASTGGEWPANVSNPTNTTAITATGIVCYEVVKNKSTGDTVATNGVSHTNGNPVQLNRIFPTAADVTTYAENFANTPGYRITTDPTTSTLQTPSNNHTSVITNNSYDHFVLLFADDENKHHFAKITEYIKDDDGNRTSFEFTPSYGKEIPKGTKFTIFKGPQFKDGSGNLVNTDVIAVAYGLRMAGSGNKHANHTFLSRPNFYFYEDRVNNPSELDHNTKYTLYSSRSDGSSVSHIKTVFSTVQDFGERIIDNSLFSYNIKLVDNLRNIDESATNDYVDWDTAIANIQRRLSDNTSNSYTGPTRYLHYTSSPEECSLHTNVMDFEINKNISVSGDYCEIKLTDTQRILSHKIKENDPLTIRKNLTNNSMSEEYDAQLIGTFTGTSGSTSLTATLENGQDLTNLLKSGANYQDIKLGNHYYSISAISAVSSNTQTLTISHFGSSISGRSSGGLQESYSSQNAFRPRWSTITQNLIVDFELDSRISDLEIFLTQGTLAGTRLPFATVDTNNKFTTITYETGRFNSVVSSQHILDFYVGSYIIDKKVFEGVVEVIIEESIQGIPSFKVIGRNKVRELLGPIINRNYTHSEDMIYSTYGPLAFSNAVVNASLTTIQSTGAVAINATTITVNHHSDTLGNQAIYVGQLIFNSDKHFVGEVAAFDNDASSGTYRQITLKDGAMTSLASSEVLHLTSFPLFSFSKAIQSNHHKTNSVTSLDSSANKGLIFTSGKDLNTNITLIGSSLNTDKNARGFNISSPDNIDKDNNFYCALTGLEHAEYYKKYAESKIVNSVMSYDVIDIEQKDNKSIIELAPLCPAILARENLNRENVALETLIDTGWTFSANVSNASNFTLTIGSSNWGNLPFDFATHQPEYIYEEDGTVIGKVLWKRAKQTHNGSSGQTISYNISLDRFYTSVAGTKIYRIDSYKNSQLSFLNKQGIDVGGVVQLVNPQYSVNNRPIGFRDITSETFHGQNLYRYLDTHSSDSASITGKNVITVDMDAIQTIMATTSNLRTISSSYKFYPGSGFNSSIVSDGNLGAVDRVLNHAKTENKPVVGSNFADAKNYSAATSTFAPHNFKLNTNYSKMDSLPKATIDTSLDWGRGNLGRQSSFREEDQGRLNAINRAREYLEHIHKSAEKYFIFSVADIYPDSKQRETNILNGSKLFTDYNIMLYGEPTKEESSITYEDLIGSASRENNTDENFETLTISESSINPSEIKRFGVMRLTELCFDWHFNVVDPENIVEHKTTIPNFIYSAQNIIDRSSHGTVTGAVDYNASSNTTIEIPASSHGLGHSGGELIFYEDGNMVGKLHSSSTANTLIFLNSENPNGIGSNKNGEFPVHTGTATKLYKIKSAFFSGEELVDTLVMGQGKEDTLLNIKGFTTDSHVADLSNFPTNRNEGFGMYRGAVFKKDDTAANHKFDHVNFESIQLNDQNIQLPLMLQQRTSGSYVNNNSLIVQSDSWTEAEITSGQIISNASNVRTVGTLTGITCTDVATTGSTSNDLEVTVITEQIGGGGYNFATSKVFITNNPSGSYVDGDTVKILKADIGTSGGTDIEFTVRRGTGSSGNGVLDRIHPSRVIEALQVNSQGNNTGASNFIVNKDTILTHNIYYPSRIVLFDKYNLDRGTSGSSNSPNNLNIPNFDGMCLAVGEGAVNVKIDAKTGGARFSSLFLPLYENFAVGADVKAGDYIGMGAEYFFKPILKLKVQSSTSSGVPALETTTKNGTTHTTIHINNYSDYISSDGAGNDHPNNYWLDFGPNLTGYYLADMNGYMTDIDDVSSTRYSGFEMELGSSYSVQPEKLLYVVSHTIIGDSNGITHKIVLDGDISTAVTPFLRYYRIFKPSEVCFHENTPNKLEFYTMNSEYTKMPRSDKMYGDVADTNTFQNSIVGLQGSNAVIQGESVSPPRKVSIGYKDAVLSMYVIIDSDRLGSGDNYVVRDPTNFFGEDKALGKGNYTFYTSDGITKRKQSFGLETFSITGIRGSSFGRTITVPTLTFADKFEKQLGIVSFSTPFTVTSPRPTKLRRASNAKIGCSVSIALEAEDIINDILERNNIQFDNTTPEFEYFIGPNFQGADAYSAINFLARLKNKRLDFDGNNISLTKILDSSNFTKAFITDENPDYKITSVTRENSLFDYYNDINVYGRGVKSKVRDIRGIKKFGTKTLEVTDESLTTQEEVDTEARRLLKQHTENSKRVTVTLGTDKLKYLRVGDVVDFESKYNGIVRGEYLVLGIKYEIGPMQLELGVFNAGLQAKLAEILIDNKKSRAFIRGQTFKENEETAINLEQYRVKPIKLIITKTTSAGSFLLGFSQTLNIGTATLGFTGGTSSTTTTLKEINL